MHLWKRTFTCAAGNCVKLDKVLYGLKESSRTWNRELVRILKNFGFKQLFADSSVFVRGIVTDDVVIIVLHVDDQNVFVTTRPLIDDFKAALHAQYGIEDLGGTRYFLGIEILRDPLRRTLKLWKIYKRYSYTIWIAKFWTRYNTHLSYGLCAAVKRQVPRVQGGGSCRGFKSVLPAHRKFNVLDYWDTTWSRTTTIRTLILFY